MALLGEKALRDAAWNVTRNGRRARPCRRHADFEIKREGGAGVTSNWDEWRLWDLTENS